MKKSILFMFVFSVALIVATGCSTIAELPETSTAPKVEAAAASSVVVAKLSWNTKEERKAWSAALTESIETHWAVLKTAPDLKRVCPKYESFSEAEKKNAWAELFVNVAYYESAWKPDTKYFEKTMGYYSEGLYQLSVVDESWAKCGLTATTILEPITNIKCGVKIMARQITKKQNVFLSKGLYWAVIKDVPEKMERMKTRMIKTMPKCGG